MYENKILVNIYILSLSRNYEMFIPVNEKVGHLANLLSNIMMDSIDFSKSIMILNARDSFLHPGDWEPWASGFLRP